MFMNMLPPFHDYALLSENHTESLSESPTKIAFFSLTSNSEFFNHLITHYAPSDGITLSLNRSRHTLSIK